MGYDADETGMGNTANWATKAQSLAVKSTLLAGKDLALDWNRETAVYYAFKAVDTNKNLADSKDETLPFIVNVDSNGKKTDGVDKKTGIDGYGRPATYYTTSTQDKAYATAVAEPELVIENASMTRTDLIKALDLTDAQADAALVTIYEDGVVTAEATQFKDDATAGEFGSSIGAYGQTVEIYKTSAKGAATAKYTVVVINTLVAKIPAIAADATEVTLVTNYASTQDVKVAVGDLKENDVVSFNIYKDVATDKYTAENVTVLEGTQGKVTATSTEKNYVRIDGTLTYLSEKIGGTKTTVSTLQGQIATFYYDSYGNILYVGAATDATKQFDGYVLLKSAASSAAGSNVLDTSDAEAKYEIVDLATGETSVVNAAIGKNANGVWVYADKNGKLAVSGATEVSGTAKVYTNSTAVGDAVANVFYGYYLQDDGSYVLEKLETGGNKSQGDAITGKNTATVNAITTAFADANTELTYVTKDASTGVYTVTTVTGIANFPTLTHKDGSEGTKVSVVTDEKTKKITKVFVYDASETVVTPATYGVYIGNGEYDEETGLYGAIYNVNGEEKTYYFASAYPTATKGVAYKLVVDADGKTTATTDATAGFTVYATAQTIAVAEDSYVVYATSTVKNLATNCNIVDLTAKQTGYVANAKANIYTVTANGKEEAVVIVITD
jgi:hypothetical protein